MPLQRLLESDAVAGLLRDLRRLVSWLARLIGGGASKSFDTALQTVQTF